MSGGDFYTALMTKAKQQKITASVLMEVASESDLIPIFPAGISMGQDGRGPYVLSNAALVIENSKRDPVDLVIDRDHAADHLPPGQERHAAGWIKTLVERDGEIWATVEWTPRAKQQLKDREYRYISPTFDYDPNTREVTRIKRATLTNTPNLNMQAVASEGADADDISTPQSDKEETPEMDKKYQLAISAIAVAMAMESTSEPEAVQAKVLERLAEGTATASELGNLRTKLKLDDKADVKTVVETASAAIGAAPSAKDFVPMAAHMAVVDKLAKLETITASEKTTSAIDEAIKAGKLAPAQKEWATAYASEDPAGFKKYIDAAPVIVTASETLNGKPTATATALDAADVEVCSMLGITQEAYKKAQSA